MNGRHLVEGPLPALLAEQVLRQFGEDPLAGAHAFFLGQVRADDNNGKKVLAIEYSAYPAMAEAEAEKIIGALRESYPDLRSIFILHSTGRVEAGEISLLVAVSSGHRKEAFEACSAAVEMIKASLPVWKKEICTDGSHSWI